MLNNFDGVILRAKQLQGELSVKQFASKLGMTQQTVDLYMKGARKPSLEFVNNICLCFKVSADWLLGLPERPNGAVTVNAPVSGAAVAVGNATATVGGDCAKCQLMIEHIRQITGRG